MRRRLRREDGFGLIELTIAMVVLNVGILALVAAFNSGAVALRRASTISNGTVVADKVMEVYRGMRNDAIYLTGGTGSDVSGYPNGIPNSSSVWYAAYHADTDAYAKLTYYDNTTPSNSPAWATDNTTNVTSYSPIKATNIGDVPSGLTDPDPTKAVQLVTGPDGQQYVVFTYIVMVQPSGTGWTGGYVKQVTVVVHDPRSSSTVIARESSLFDPNVAP